MKKNMFMAMLLVVSMSAVVGCDNKTPTTSSGGGATPGPVSGPRLEINYLRHDQSYTDWGIWAWNKTTSENYGMLFDREATYSSYDESLKWAKLVIQFGQEYERYTNWAFTASTKTTITEESLKDADGNLGIIIRTGAGDKDPYGEDRMINMARADADNDHVYEVYIVTDDINLYYSIDAVPTGGIKSTEFGYSATNDFLRVNANVAPDPRITADKVHITGSDGSVLAVSSVGGYSSGHVDIALTNRLSAEDLKKSYTVVFDDHPIADGSGYPISMNKYYASEAFDSIFTYDGQLGSYIDNGHTYFKLWAPTATAVKLNLYDDGLATTPSSTIALTEGEKGVWTHDATGNLHGKYYSYDVTVYGKTNSDVADPYGQSANANGKHSMVVDFSHSSVLPDNWSSSTAPSVASESAPIVYETHVRDFTMNDSWRGTAANKGKYLGLAETNTTLDDNSTKTGFDYVKELGVTHVQLLPIYDFKSVDETKLSDTTYQNQVTNGVYNWGYDPQSYNAPEGSYSSNPNDGTTRVKELRQAIQAYNQSGIGIIMDVVYNHMPGASDATFEQIVPGYYFRGTNDSGAGADMASEKPMFKKFIVDSTKQWMVNYKLSGFRFDLMGLITREAMRDVSTTLHGIKSDAIIYGEGWSMFSSSPNSPSLTNADMAVQGNVKGFNIGAFNDTIRDALKGSVFNADEPGWATALDAAKTSTAKENVKYGIVGTYLHSQVSSTSSTVYDLNYTGASVNYAEAHDNETLHDKIRLSVPGLTDDEYNKIQVMVNNIIMTSYGISFFHSGTEFGRTKLIPANMVDSVPTDKVSCTADGVCYSKDSYNLTDKVNAIDWNLVKTNEDMVNSFKAAASIKTQNPMLRGNTYENMDTRFVFDDAGYAATSAEALGLIAFTLSPEASSSDTYAKMYIVHNANSTAITVSGHEGWTYLMGGNGKTGASISVPAHSTLIIAQ